jgi:hypothetical protein
MFEQSKALESLENRKKGKITAFAPWKFVRKRLVEIENAPRNDDIVVKVGVKSNEDHSVAYTR